MLLTVLEASFISVFVVDAAALAWAAAKFACAVASALFGAIAVVVAVVEDLFITRYSNTTPPPTSAIVIPVDIAPIFLRLAIDEFFEWINYIFVKD